ncbi:MAG: hypothetical protein V1644_00640 [Candidatus Micrarchaeota archaeon]
MYVNIPVKENTKEVLDTFRRIFGVRSYDDTVIRMTQSCSYLLIKDLEGSLKDTPRFKRDKSDWRDFD